MLLSVSTIIYDVILSSIVPSVHVAKGYCCRHRDMKKEKEEAGEEAKQLPPGTLQSLHFGTEQFSFHPGVRTVVRAEKRASHQRRDCLLPLERKQA